MMIMSKREKKKQQVETLRSFAKNKRKIMLKYSCLSLCVYMYVCVSTQVEELTNFTRRAFWKKHLQNKKLYSNHIMPASGFDPANICQIPFVRPLNYNCKLTARLMVGPTTTITESRADPVFVFATLPRIHSKKIQKKHHHYLVSVSVSSCLFSVCFHFASLRLFICDTE